MPGARAGTSVLKNKLQIELLKKLNENLGKGRDNATELFASFT